MPTHFTLKVRLNASAKEVYDAWLNSKKHSDMTGGQAIVSDKVKGKFSAWDGYIYGSNVELIPNEKIVQSWRTAEFGDTDKVSLLEIKLKDTPKGCEITLSHSTIPDNQSDYESGWDKHYFQPMKKYFKK